MADDKTKRGPADRLRINVNEPYELQYWTGELGVTEARLRQLVHSHGVMAADIRKALGK
jgi:hypothetical protein